MEIKTKIPKKPEPVVEYLPGTNIPTTVVVTEEDLDRAQKKRDAGSSITSECLLCTTFQRYGFETRGCGWDCIVLNDQQIRMKNSEQLIFDYIFAIDKARACLPFVVENCLSLP